jgi:hypothetical protein
MRKVNFFAALLCLLGWMGVAEAQYVLTLKNGRQITVQSYREEGTMIKFAGMGGEMAISKDQVQSIRPAGAKERIEAAKPALERQPEPAVAQPPSTVSKPADVRSSTAPAATADQGNKDRAEEEKAYQQKVKELTQQIRELRERYSLITRGNKGPEPSFFTTEEAFRGHQEDLLSRLRDAQFRAQGLPSGSDATSPPFSLNPPPAYSEKQKELSDLRNRISGLESDRQRLIEEMKAKNFDTASLFLD